MDLLLINYVWVEVSMVPLGWYSEWNIRANRIYLTRSTHPSQKSEAGRMNSSLKWPLRPNLTWNLTRVQVWLYSYRHGKGSGLRLSLRTHLFYFHIMVCGLRNHTCPIVNKHPYLSNAVVIVYFIVMAVGLYMVLRFNPTNVML